MELIADNIESMGCVSLALFSAVISLIFIAGIWLAAKVKNSKTNSSRKILKCLDSPVTQHNSHPKTSHTVVKPSRYLSSKKRRGTKTKNPIPHTKTNEDRLSLSESVVKNWLESDTYCYENNFINSENLMSYQVIRQETNAPIVVNESNNFNSCSSNEDRSLTSTEKINPSTKKTKRNKQRPRNRSKYPNNKSIIPRKGVGDEEKVNLKTSDTLLTSTKNGINLRKHCTKTAALKAVLTRNHLSSKSVQEYRTLESFLAVNGSLSSSSSSITSNSSSISSSASSSSRGTSPTSKRHKEHLKKMSLIHPLKQFTKLNMNEHDFARELKRYTIDPNLLRIYGYPVESIHYRGCVDVYKCLPKHLAEESVTKDNERHHCHFYGAKKLKQTNAQNGYASSVPDSGNGSEESSPRYSDSDSSEAGEEKPAAPLMAFYTPDGVYQVFPEYCTTRDKECVRCSKTFQVNERGVYSRNEPCIYHWGKLNRVYDGKHGINAYTCCQREEFSEGCFIHPMHVWNGTVVGLNGPYTGFYHTQKPKSHYKYRAKVYALDCEMSYTSLGLELTKVTVVGFNGSLVYEHFVRPQAPIIDYNTRFSGVSEKDFLPGSYRTTKTLFQVQMDLLNLFDTNTILIGHGLENDLKALKLMHKTIVDTSLVFNHSTGFPYRRSLRNLTNSFLKRDIQNTDTGHSSQEDSLACLELMMWKIRKERTAHRAPMFY